MAQKVVYVAESGIKATMVYSAEITCLEEAAEFAKILVEELDKANREDKKLTCEIWREQDGWVEAKDIGVK